MGRSQSRRKLAQTRRFVCCCERFDFATSLKAEDLREDYGEERIIAIGKIRRTLHALVYTRRSEGAIRVITRRKATAEERRLYNETRTY